MVRLFLKNFVFFLLFICLLGLSDKIFQKKSIPFFANKLYRESQVNVDIAFFGSSHSFSSYDPRVFQDRLNQYTYNFGLPAERLITTQAVISEVLNRNDLKLGIIDVFSSTIDDLPTEKSKYFQLSTFDNLEFSKEKATTFSHIYGVENFLDISATLRNHSNWNERFFDDSYKIHRQYDFFNGYNTRFSFNKKEWNKYLKKLKQEKDTTVVRDLTDKQKSLLNRTIKQFKEKNIELLFVSAPFHKKYIPNSYRAYLISLKKHVNSQGVRFLDFNDLFDKLKLDETDFRDASHLNANGALKVSVFLADYIQSNFNNIIGKESINKLNNRFSILSENIPVLYEREFKSKVFKEEIGIDKIYLYQVYKNRYEVIITGGDEEKLRNLKLKINYEFMTKEKNKLYPKLETYIKKGRLIEENVSLETSYNYKGVSYTVFQFNSPFNVVSDFRINLRSHKNQNLIKLEEILLKK